MSASAGVSLLGSTVGQKIAMAASGLLVVGWLFLHMAGNLLVFAGPEALDAYAEFIQHGTHGAVWLMRAVLLAAIAVHVVSAVRLARKGIAAREVRYAGGRRDQATTSAARSMRYGGVALLLYLSYHLLHMTVGSAHPEFERGAVYHNVVTAFDDPAVTAIYLLATLFLGLHLYHGVWSGLQTLGLDHPRWNRGKRPFALGIALVIAVGFALVPLAVVTGIVR
jgi:succinate dehydrogenase / fumarate reductase cytochrome b subunit